MHGLDIGFENYHLIFYLLKVWDIMSLSKNNTESELQKLWDVILKEVKFDKYNSNLKEQLFFLVWYSCCALYFLHNIHVCSIIYIF